MPTKSLKVIENMLELVYAELKTASNEPDLNDATFRLLRQCAIDAINLKRAVEEARAWTIQKG